MFPFRGQPPSWTLAGVPRPLTQPQFASGGAAAGDRIESYPLAAGQCLRYALAATALLAISRVRLPRLSGREAPGLAATARRLSDPRKLRLSPGDG
jgi:hypothetical protein